MTSRGRLLGAALGLLLVAAPFVPGSARAQTGGFTAPPECSDPAPADVEDGIVVQVISPTGTGPRTTPVVAVEARFENESRRPIVNSFNGEITKLRAYVLACAAGQVVPEPMAEVEPEGEPRTATLAWDPSFVTNGRYAIVVEADGTSSNPSGTQRARAVAPVQLAVPPSAPTNVRVSDPTNGVVTVSWEYATPEPDLIGFEVRRAKQGSGDYTTVKNGVVGPKVRTISDEPPVGAWRYHVVAYRNGAPEGAVSRDDTVEVPEAAPAADSTGTGGSTTGTGGSGTGGTAGGADGGTSTTLTTAPIGSANTPRASVDLSRFAAALNAQRQQPVGRIEPPDPGYQETLPFGAAAADATEEEPEELGADEPGVGVGLGQQPEADPAERRRSLGFVAFGLLLFVLSMTGLFVKGEVKRADLLDAVDDPDELLDADVAAAEVPAAAVAVSAVPVAAGRRRRSPEPADVEVPAAAVAVSAVPVAAGRRRRSPRPADVGAPAAALEAEVPAAAASGRRRRSAEPAAAAAAAAPDPVTAVPVTAGRRRRFAAPAPDSRRAVDPAAIAPATAPVNGSEDHALHGSATPADAAADPAEATRRRRWGAREIDADLIAPATAPVNGFDDLRDDTERRRHHHVRRPAVRAADLDAPGLDVHDPPSPTTTTSRRNGRTPTPPAKPALPTRRR